LLRTASWGSQAKRGLVVVANPTSGATARDKWRSIRWEHHAMGDLNAEQIVNKKKRCV
jgi:hypothetical protein